VIQIVLWYLDFGCSKHMTGNLSQLINFVSKFLGTIILGNDHIAKIMGYGDCQMGNVTISLVYYVEGLEGVDLLKGSRGTNLYTLSMDNLLLSSPTCLLSKASKTKSWLWHRRLSHFNFDYITSLAKQGLVRGLPKLKYQKDHLCSTCALGKSKKHSHKPKAEDSIQEKLYLLHMDLYGPMRIKSINGRKYILVIVDDYSQFTSKPDLSYLHVFGALCYPTNDGEDLTMASEQFSLGPRPKLLTIGTISSGLVQNIPSSTLYVPPTKNDWEILFQPVFDDQYLNPPPCVDHQVLAVIPPEPATLTEADHDIEVAHMDNNPYVNFLIPEPSSEESSTQVVIPNNVHPINQPPKHINKWTKDHPIDNVIDDPSRPSYKEALTESYWIKAMQEELKMFERLEVWELKFSKGTVNSTLFIRREGKDILLIQIYVDDIIFAFTKPDLYESYSKIMCSKFKMSMMGTINMGLWYSKDSCIALTTLADADDAGCQDTRKSTSGSMQLLGDRLFWYTIKKVKDADFYEFLLANKKCKVDAEVFRKILDICPRVKGEEFTEVQDDDATHTFLTDLGYKGPLHKYTNMYVDHMSQPWRTLASIINKCLSVKTASNDRLRKSRIAIMWGMFYRENVDCPKLIWKDFAFQIDHRKERKSRHENMPFPRFTKVIINHFLSQHKSLSNLKYQHYHTIKDDGIVSRLKFVRNGEDYQEHGLPILDTMLNDAIKQSQSYQIFIKYSTSQIPPKKSRGKGSRRKRTTDTPVADVDVSKESEPEPAKKNTASRRVMKKKVTISADD
ncbi:retrovirus-related pol polyprotein from transposon TNT 1-94, partial [Tanacetum coccineum]